MSKTSSADLGLLRLYFRVRTGLILGRLGYVADLRKLATAQFVNGHSYTKYVCLNRLRMTTGARTLIETGTYFGAMAYRCSKVFRSVHTIELDPTLANYASRLLGRRKNVEVIQGDAVHRLSEILARPEVCDCIVYLDAHYSGGPTAKGSVDEPALDELDILAAHTSKVRGILIDDFRTFGDDGLPSKSDLLEKAERLFVARGYRLSVSLDQVVLTGP